MPPKAAKKKRAITRGQKPASTLANDGAPFNIDDVFVRSSLLPYIELGFMPISTPGRKEDRAMNTLCISLKAAISALKITSRIPSSQLEISHFEDWFESRPYWDKAGELARKNLNKMYKDRSPAFIAEQERLCEKGNLDLSQLEILLEVANESLGTEFQLGVITQGFRVQFDMDKMRYNNNFVQDTTSYIVGGHSGDPGRPVVFIVDDNAGERGYAHRQGRGVESCWEAFTSISYGPKIKKTERNHAERAVSSWEMTDAVEVDITAGVWVVVKDYKPTKTSAGVRAGRFVRNAGPRPSGDAPDGKKHMLLGDGTTTVLVAEKDLAKVENGEVLEPVAAISIPQKSPSPAKVPRLPAKVPASNKTQTVKRKCIDMSYPELTRWRIFRTLRPPLNKLGESLKPAVQEVDIVPHEGSDYRHHAYQPEFWNLVLDQKKPKDGLQVIKFINEDEDEHQIFNRNLQALENPFGLGDFLPIVPEFQEFELDEDSTTDEILTFAETWGLEAKGKNDAEILESARKSYESRTMVLPMAQVMTREASPFGFCLQEIVYVHATKGTDSIVRDYEGTEGIIPTEFLEPFEKPWGLLVLSVLVEVPDEPDPAGHDSPQGKTAKKKGTKGKGSNTRKAAKRVEENTDKNTDKTADKPGGKAAAAKQKPGAPLPKPVSPPKKKASAGKKRKAEANELEQEPAKKKPATKSPNPTSSRKKKTSAAKKSSAEKGTAQEKDSSKKSKPATRRAKD